MPPSLTLHRSRHDSEPNAPRRLFPKCFPRPPMADRHRMEAVWDQQADRAPGGSQYARHRRSATSSSFEIRSPICIRSASRTSITGQSLSRIPGLFLHAIDRLFLVSRRRSSDDVTRIYRERPLRPGHFIDASFEGNSLPIQREDGMKTLLPGGAG